ncbi:hypothetical protein N9W62_05475 [Akkermansiaceae bacterium]|nr:hypothetical protein [Akkermansiaceae bacterium]
MKSRNVLMKESVVFATYLRPRCSSQLLSNHGGITPCRHLIATS